MATIGSIEPYDPSSGDWEAYQERLEMFLDANAVAEGQRVATLLTVIGGTAYKIVRNLVAPASPKNKTYTELMDALSAHFSPKPLVIAERYRFHKRDQLPGESIATYVAELRRFARHCNFGTNLDSPCARSRIPISRSPCPATFVSEPKSTHFVEENPNLLVVISTELRMLPNERFCSPCLKRSSFLGNKGHVRDCP